MDDALTEPTQDPDAARKGIYRSDGKGPFALNDAAAVIDGSTTWRAMFELVRADTQRLREFYNEPVYYRVYPILLVSWSYRLSHTLRRRGHKFLPVVVMWMCFLLTGCQINPSAVIGPGLLCIHPQTTNIGGGVIIGRNAVLQGVNSVGALFRDSRTRPEALAGSPRIGDDVYFGNKSSIYGTISIGDRVVIGACSLVLHDAPDDAVIKGSPAR
jgi:serine O-acetyltransferase